jgi:folate-binding protein YgfZ
MPSSFPNLLRDVHRQAEAEFQVWADTEIVQTFGEPQAEYAAIRKSAGLIDLPQRGLLEISGKDRLPFLNNLLTNQTWDKPTKSALPAGQGVYSFLLNVKGRVVADMNVLELGDRTLLEVETRFVQPLRDVLEKYLFAEQVKLVDRVGEFHEIALHGPGAPDVLGVIIDRPLASARAKLFDVDVIVWRDDATGSAGLHVIVPTGSVRSVWMNLLTRFGAANEPAERRALRPVGWAAFNATRIEAGRPVLGIDFDGASIASAAPGKRDDANEAGGDAAPGGSVMGALPAETGPLFDRAVSMTKGCYLGQEIVARMHARGQVSRQIVGIRMETDALPIAGTQIFDAQDQSNPIGLVTSSTISPVLSNAAVCLATIKRPHFTLGTTVRIAAEGAMHTGHVVAIPFVKV